MPMGQEPERLGNPLTVTNEPVGPKTPGGKGTMGGQACTDALFIVGGAWVLLLLLIVSLRRHTV